VERKETQSAGYGKKVAMTGRFNSPKEERGASILCLSAATAFPRIAAIQSDGYECGLGELCDEEMDHSQWAGFYNTAGAFT
jgi:hypothetical protein